MQKTGCRNYCCPRAGLRVNGAVCATPPAVAVTVAVVDVDTAAVATANVALTRPAATVTDAGTVSTLVLLDNATTTPPAGAAAVNVTVPVALAPPVTDAGFSDNADSVTRA